MLDHLPIHRYFCFGEQDSLVAWLFKTQNFIYIKIDHSVNRKNLKEDYCSVSIGLGLDVLHIKGSHWDRLLILKIVQEFASKLSKTQVLVLSQTSTNQVQRVIQVLQYRQ